MMKVCAFLVFAPLFVAVLSVLCAIAISEPGSPLPMKARATSTAKAAKCFLKLIFIVASLTALSEARVSSGVQTGHQPAKLRHRLGPRLTLPAPASSEESAVIP